MNFEQKLELIELFFRMGLSLDLTILTLNQLEQNPNTFISVAISNANNMINEQLKMKEAKKEEVQENKEVVNEQT